MKVKGTNPDVDKEKADYSSEDEDSIDSEESSSDDSNDDDEDDDDVEAMAVDYSSVPSYSLAEDFSTSLQKNYICQMCGSEQLNQVAITSSDFTVSVYDCNQFKKLSSFSGHSNSVTSVRFSPTGPHQLYSASTDGTIRLWDTRKPGGCVQTLNDDLAKSGHLKPFLSFDISKSGTFLCAGTELFEGDAFLDFWDVRTLKLLGGYWESHSDDITQVCFHPLLADIVTSASTDGLLNVYDLSKATEDDALLSSLNTESSVDMVCWHTLDGVVKGLTCVTDTMDVQTWDRDGSAPQQKYMRCDISKVMKTPASDTYVVNIHCTSEGQIGLLVGATKDDGEDCLSLLHLHKELLQPNAFLTGSKQRARCSWINEEQNYLVVGGESGNLSKWHLKSGSSESSGASNNTPLKMKQNLIQSRVKPY